MKPSASARSEALAIGTSCSVRQAPPVSGTRQQPCSRVRTPAWEERASCPEPPPAVFLAPAQVRVSCETGEGNVSRQQHEPRLEDRDGDAGRLQAGLCLLDQLEDMVIHTASSILRFSGWTSSSSTRALACNTPAASNESGSCFQVL